MNDAMFCPDCQEYAAPTLEKTLGELATLRTENEQLRVQLAGCATAAQGWIDDPAKPSDYGWSPAYQDVLNLRLRARAMEQFIEFVGAQCRLGHGMTVDQMSGLYEAYERVIKS